MYEVLQRSTYISSLLTSHFFNHSPPGAILNFNKLVCQTEGLVRDLTVDRSKSFFVFLFFSISNIGNSSRGLLRITAGNCGIRSPSLRNMSRVGSWETTQCINTVPTVAAEGATPPSSNSASNVLSWPPALGGNSFVIWGKQPFLP